MKHALTGLFLLLTWHLILEALNSMHKHSVYSVLNFLLKI